MHSDPMAHASTVTVVVLRPVHESESKPIMLLLTRAIQDRYYGFKEFVGGYADAGEEPEQAALREV